MKELYMCGSVTIADYADPAKLEDAKDYIQNEILKMLLRHAKRYYKIDNFSLEVPVWTDEGKNLMVTCKITTDYDFESPEHVIQADQLDTYDFEVGMELVIKKIDRSTGKLTVTRK